MLVAIVAVLAFLFIMNIIVQMVDHKLNTMLLSYCDKTLRSETVVEMVARLPFGMRPLFWWRRTPVDGTNVEELARYAYTTYVNAIEEKHLGSRLSQTEWTELSPEMREVWQAVAVSVVAFMRVRQLT